MNLPRVPSAVVLDACRNNPLPVSVRDSRDTKIGLASVQDVPTGTLIAFSTGAGAVAEDGPGDNSPYAKLLAEHLFRPDVPSREVFHLVAEQMRERTGGKQEPFLGAQVFPRLKLVETPRPVEDSDVRPPPQPPKPRWPVVAPALGLAALLGTGGALTLKEEWRDTLFPNAIIDKVPGWRINPMQAGFNNVLIAASAATMLRTSIRGPLRRR
jgi:hypothetical protein